jgi:hypothetical protein
MGNIDLIIISLISGVWNVLRDLTNSVKHKISVFILGFVFCYGSALIAEFYGFSSEISAFIGYVCGVLSNQIYDALARIVNKAPEILEKKIDDDK